MSVAEVDPAYTPLLFHKPALVKLGINVNCSVNPPLPLDLTVRFLNGRAL